MKISNSIHKTEKEYLPALEAFFLENWGKTNLWSHELSHHRRVWEYAKELLYFINQAEKITECRFIEKLLIACYLHDLGMAIDQGDRHGLHSRKLCEQFLSENNLDRSDYLDVLEAIDNHDNKEYSGSQSDSRLLLLLSAADDLDAFGYTGIYRYIEIYLARGVHPDNIGRIVRENAEKRFKHFSSSFAQFPELVDKHRTRYLVLDHYFEGLCKELNNNG
jgi:HD superfamily phosphodiesterase